MRAEAFLDAGTDLLLEDGVGGDTFFLDEFLNLWRSMLVSSMILSMECYLPRPTTSRLSR